jgi:Ca2+-binding RTX toxin-like protein
MTLATDRSGTTSSSAYTVTFRPPSESIETSELTLEALSVPESAGYYPYYLERQYFEWQNGVLGDINGDGFDDYYFGSDTPGHTLYRPRLRGGSEDSAALVQIVYGQAEGWSGASPRTTSFILGGDAVFDELGLPDMGIGEELLGVYRVTPLGDLNTDGFDDFALGERMFLGGPAGLEESYSWEDLAQRPLLQPQDRAGISDTAIKIDVVLDGIEQVLQAVAVGDVNGDGIGDYVTPVRVSTYGTPFDAAQDASGPVQQYPVQSGGRFDTLDALHLVYGRQEGFSDTIDLDQRDPATGFDIRGFEQIVETREYNGIAYDVSRVSYGALVSGGDMDGDGVNDIMISTVAGFRNSIDVPGVYYGDYAVRNYLLFGNTEAGGDIDLGSLSPGQGLVQEYVPNRTTYGGRRIPGLVELGGDINGDGFNDAISVTGDYAEADYGGRVDLKVLYGSDFRNNAAFQGDAQEDDLVVVAKGGSVFTLGGNDTVLIRPVDRSQSISVDTGAGNDLIKVSLGDASTGIHARLAGGAGSDAYSISTTSSLLGGAGGAGIPNNTIVIDDLSLGGYASGNSLTVGFGSSQGAGFAIPRLGFGSLLLTFADLDLAIHLENFDRNRVLEGPRDIDTFDFGDGAVFSYEQLLARGVDLEGTTGDDLIEGSSVTDRINGEAGADILIGGRGDDELHGGTGNDLLDGGMGDDVYRFHPGDGADRITDAGGLDRIVFGAGLDIAAASVRRAEDDLEIGFDNPDTLLVSDWFASAAGRVEQFFFDDGTSLTAADIEQRLPPSGITLSGTDSRESLVGTQGDDRIHGHGGNDYLFGLAGDDLLVGGGGYDRLYGGAGDDIFSVAASDGFDRFQGGEGYDRILGAEGDERIGLRRQFGPNNSIEEIDGGTGHNLIVGSGLGDTLDFSATDLVNIDEIQGGRGSDTIVGTAGDDRIVGGDGWDRLYGGNGNDSYIFRRGDDRDVIRDSAGEQDRLLLADVDSGEAWFSRQGDDLLVSVVGTYDRVRVADWYGNGRIEQVHAADGRYLTDASVDQLVSAMAAFNPLYSGITEGGVNIAEPLQAEIAAAWQTS